MPINPLALAKHGLAQIIHLPVFCRVPAIPEDEEGGPAEAGALFPASFDSNAGGLQAVDGGTVYDRGGTLVVSKAHWPEGLREDQFIEVMSGGAVTQVGEAWVISAPGTWKAYNIENVGGTENPCFTELRVAIGPANN